MLRDYIHKVLDKLNVNRRDVIVFALSLLLAFSIWLIHNLTLSYSDLVSVAVVAQSDLEGHSDKSSNACTIVARCRTTGFNLIRLHNFSDKKAETVFFSGKDLHHVKGEEFSISSEELSNYLNDIFGDGIRLESFTAKSFTFRFPYENHKKVPVQAMEVLSFRPQYMALGKMKLDPDSVTIYGEPYHLDQIDRVNTETLDLSDLHSSSHGIVKIAKMTGVRFSHLEVNYSLEVSRYVEMRESLPVSVLNVPYGKSLSVYPSKAEIIMRCAFPVTSNPSGKVRVYVDYNDFTKSINGRCTPKTNRLPEGVISCQISPQVFDCVENGR